MTNELFFINIIITLICFFILALAMTAGFVYLCLQNNAEKNIPPTLKSSDIINRQPNRRETPPFEEQTNDKKNRTLHRNELRSVNPLQKIRAESGRKRDIKLGLIKEEFDDEPSGRNDEG